MSRLVGPNSEAYSAGRGSAADYAFGQSDLGCSYAALDGRDRSEAKERLTLSTIWNRASMTVVSA